MVYVMDVNDNAPQFQNLDFRSGYIASLRVDASNGTIIKSVPVHDADATPPNNIVQLRVLPPHNEIFGFKGTNLIVKKSATLKSMEGQRYTVVISAKDLGTPSLSNRTVIKVYVQPTRLSSKSSCERLSVMMYDQISPQPNIITSNSSYMEINDISSYNATLSYGLWLIYSSTQFEGESVVMAVRTPETNIPTTKNFRSLRGFCTDSALLAIFSQQNFTGKMTVLFATASKLSLKGKSAVAINNSWAISWLSFSSPRLLECSREGYSIFRSLPKEIGVPLVRGVKKLTKEGVAKFKAVYG
jgi:hypothetical protein